ncbi:hypothetical protein VWY34_14190 [Phaeobacter sp. JH20_02]|uniref:hypothetical protein n=1 Tax=unclassified Phaeobacter TaxID=2621772 RepID=UPI003A8686C0
MVLPRRISEPGPIIDYINMLLRLGRRDLASEAVQAVRAVFRTDEGAIVLELLEKSTLERTFPVDNDLGALAASNAQSFIPLDLRRILSDEIDAALEAHSTDTGTSRRGRPRG